LWCPAATQSGQEAGQSELRNSTFTTVKGKFLVTSKQHISCYNPFLQGYFTLPACMIFHVGYDEHEKYMDGEKGR
jgi:hypothetical protein